MSELKRDNPERIVLAKDYRGNLRDFWLYGVEGDTCAATYGTHSGGPTYTNRQRITCVNEDGTITVRFQKVCSDGKIEPEEVYTEPRYTEGVVQRSRRNDR